jgi:hypothetical protein
MGLKLIDCQTRLVVHAESSFHYVALSYVWGAVTVIERRKGLFPSTIRDSMKVVLKLGYRYLWVDKYVWAGATSYYALGD